jgi:hypothetical protein
MNASWLRWTGICGLAITLCPADRPRFLFGYDVAGVQNSGLSIAHQLVSIVNHISLSDYTDPITSAIR